MNNDLLAAASSWPLPCFDKVDIDYRLSDIWANAGSDPHIEYVEYVWGEVYGVRSGGATRDQLGTLGLARIDLNRLEARGVELAMVLDSHSLEWSHSYGGIELAADDGSFGLLDSSNALLIVDRVQLIPEARGHDLGLHALARALRTWMREGDFVVLDTYPIEEDGVRLDEPDDIEERATVMAAAERLAAHWAKLGFKRATEPGEWPVLSAHSRWQDLDDAVHAYCSWSSPSNAAL
jgi:GNAT superfamily N-acetyltransferase